jgi:DNA polymerase/3'-5' exonuclease PolX
MSKTAFFSNSINIVNKENTKIINEFINYYKFVNTNRDLLDKTPKEIFYKLNNLLKVIQILSNYKNKITIDELPNILKIKYIGEKTINRIKEILETGKLNEIYNIKNKQKIIEELTKIYSIGSKRAIDIYNSYNILDFKDFKNKVKSGEIQLTYQQKLGLKYINKTTDKIPNLIISYFDKYLQKTIKKFDDRYLINLCGSYRRNKPFSKDIDILITHKNIKSIIQCKEYLTQILEILNDFIVDSLTINYNNHFQCFSSFKNILKTNYKTNFKLNSVFRVDVIVVPFECYHTGLFHFTGSGVFNRKIRNIAKSKNMKLNEYYLFDENNKKIKIKSEKDIFKKLNLEFINPENRN